MIKEEKENTAISNIEKNYYRVDKKKPPDSIELPVYKPFNMLKGGCHEH